MAITWTIYYQFIYVKSSSYPLKYVKICKLENIVLARQNSHALFDTDAHINNTNIHFIQLIFPKKMYFSYIFAIQW